MVGGEAVQVIAPSPEHAVGVVDLRDCPLKEREERGRRICEEQAQRPFNLSRGPLFRSLLVRLGEEDQILLLTMHHIVSDGWSMGVLHRELSTLYQAFVNGESSPLAELSIQYADYAVWQREWLTGEVLERQVSYWKKQLAGIPEVLKLPTDRPRPTVQSHRGGQQSFVLSKDVTEQLKALSRKEGVTLFMTLLAALQTLLYRYTGQEDIVVGSPIANRNRSEIEGLIGFFVNTLALRTDLSGTPTFRELLQRVRKMALEAYGHQDLPFEKLVEELKPERSLIYSPLVQVFFNMLSPTPIELDLSGITATRILFSDVESKFEMTLYSKEEQDQIHLDLVCRADLFDEFWMTNFLQQYRLLLDQIVKSPAQAIRNYSLVTPESHEFLPDPSIILGAPRQELVTDTFSSWAKLLPTHTAVSQGNQTWTYSELADCSYAIARFLTASGLKAGDVVAIYGCRSFGLIAGLIGTLLSGGVILTLDTNLPVHRQQLMVREANAKRLLCVVSKQGADSWMEETFGAAILFVDPQGGCPIGPESSLDSESSSLAVISDNDPAYIFFTSGTTGVPKGVLGCHKGLSHFLKWQRETFNIGPNDRVAQLTNLSFDASLRDIFLALTSGATLCLPDVSDTAVPDDVMAWLDRQRISVLHAVPSLTQSWLAFAEDGGPLAAMRWVFFVGEPLTDALVLQWRSRFRNPGEIINLYGPTETTLVKCFYRVPGDVRPGVQPVGSPIPQTQALVLAHDQQLCGINEPGEIVLRTPFRSLGYINAPEESRWQFVKNPYRDDADDLLYFTGDAGRFRPDGTLEILGRLDHQVKIHGVRVEPAEITAILAEHPGVESCIVTARKGDGGDSCLVAYAVLLKPKKTTSAELRSYLLERSPAVMVPTYFVTLDSLPLTPNGKVDRNALPPPDWHGFKTEQEYVAPATELEKSLAKIWKEIFQVPTIGVLDNFFDLGGHSLLATQIVSRLRETVRVDLPLRLLFEAPTIAELALKIEQRNSSIDKLEEIARHLAEVESLSEEEIEQQLFKQDAQIHQAQQAAMATVKK
jgi:amino acid adenylation domain-containing protein